MGFTVIVTVLVWVTLFSDAVTLYVNESSPLKFESGVYVTEPAKAKVQTIIGDGQIIDITRAATDMQFCGIMRKRFVHTHADTS